MQETSSAMRPKLAQNTAMGLLMSLECVHLTGCDCTDCSVHDKKISVFKHNCIGYALAAGARTRWELVKLV